MGEGVSRIERETKRGWREMEKRNMGECSVGGGSGEYGGNWRGDNGGRLLVELEENEKKTGGNGEEKKRKKVELEE